MNSRSNQALAMAYFHIQRYGDAADAARSAIDANPGFSIPRAILVATLMRLGRVEEAGRGSRHYWNQSLLSPFMGFHSTPRLNRQCSGPLPTLCAKWAAAGVIE